MSNLDETDFRDIYARQILAKAGIAQDVRLARAFATVKREDFVGPPPWMFSDFGQYKELASSDPAILYQDMMVGLSVERHINNGMPSLHAHSLHHLRIRDGETVVHLGAGSGYYSAIMAELVGPSGTVIAVEYDEALAAKAKAALAEWPQVTVIHGNAFDWPAQDADVIYANFALDAPPPAWIDNLSPGGRVLFPLGVPAIDGGRASGVSRYAAFLMIDREPGGFAARFLQPVSFIWGEGQPPASDGRHEALTEAFRRRGLLRVRSFRWRTARQADEWYGEDEWGLSFAEP